MMNVKAELEDVYNELNNQITQIKQDWAASNPNVRPENIYALRDSNGGYFLTNLLVAEAQVLSALAFYEGA